MEKFLMENFIFCAVSVFQLLFILILFMIRLILEIMRTLKNIVLKNRFIKK